MEGSGSRSASLKERVLRVLREEIRTGVLGLGVRLVESELTRRLQVSRTPLREALRQLEAEGLVVVEPHKGARVSRKSATELWEHYRIYAALHGLAAELATAHLTAADLERLRELQAVLEHPDAPAQGMEWIACNTEFHAVFVRRAQSQALSDLLEKQAAYLSRYWPLGLHAPGVLEASHAHHRNIVALCDPAQPVPLRAAVEEHFLATGRMLLQHASDVYAV